MDIQYGMIEKSLTIFRTAAAVRSFTGAAKLLGMSQPNVTQQIAALERELGVTLFLRTGRRIELSAAGEVLQKECGRLFAAETDLVRKVRNVALRKRTFTLGGTATAGSFLLTGLLAGYRKRHPDREVYFKPGTHAELRDLLISGNLDLALTEETNTRDDLLPEPYCLDRLIPVFAPGSLDHARFSLKGYLRSGGALFVANSADGEALTRFLRAHRIAGEPAETGSFDAAKMLAAAGSGIAVLSDLAAETEIKAGILRAGAFAEGEITRRIGFAYSADGDQAFIRDFIRYAVRHRGRSLHKLETNSYTGE